MISEKDREIAHELFPMFQLQIGEGIEDVIERCSPDISSIRAEAMQDARAEDHTRRWNFEKTDDGIRICFGEHDRSNGCEYVEYVPKTAISEAVKAERDRIKLVLENLECVNGNETEIRRQDAIDAILSDDQEARNG